MLSQVRALGAFGHPIRSECRGTKAHPWQRLLSRMASIFNVYLHKSVRAGLLGLRRSPRDTWGSLGVPAASLGATYKMTKHHVKNNSTLFVVCKGAFGL